MKAYFQKVVSGLGTLSRGVDRRRNSDSSSEQTDSHELNTVSDGRFVTPVGGGRMGSGRMGSGRTPPSSSAASAECLQTPEEDDILFRKNNVLLRYPKNPEATSPGVLDPSLQDSSEMNPTRDASQDEDQILIPGFLFVTTRGSNFGTTLILNWAPNSSICIPSSSSSSSGSDVSSSNGVEGKPACSNPTSFDRPSCSSVSIDLGMMEMIRIFYHTDIKGFITSGEMVITSKDRKFKVFHFKTGGLNDLIYLLRSWKFFNHQCHRESHQHTFTIFRPKLSLSELHPEEGSIKSVLTEEVWRGLMDREGKVTGSQSVLKVVFFQGVYPRLRKEVWPFLLQLYSFDSTLRDRTRIRLKRSEEYSSIDTRRRRKEQQQQQQRASEDRSTVVQQIEKDVVRTDRSHPYYRGEDNSNVAILRSILLNYLEYKPDISYSQGMTDLLAPVLAALDDESEAFWCFTRLVESSAFFKPGRHHVSVERQLEPLRILIKMLIPQFFSYLEQTEGGLSLMFCHRWLLVCLKREFQEEDALTIWEACWTNYETTSFHLFVCVAIMAIYGQKAVDRNMNINELMVFFNTLSLTMPHDIVLSQARGYLNKFRSSAEVNCVLYPLMHEEFWERAGSPKLVCSVCRGFGSCRRTGFVTDKEIVC